MNMLLWGSCGYKTTRTIIEAMGPRFNEGNERVRRFRTTKGECPRGEKGDIAIRFGTTYDGLSPDVIDYQKPEGICNGSNKGRARQMLHKAGVPVPTPVKLDGEDIDIRKLPIIIRPNYHHQGKDFTVINTAREFLKWYDEHKDNLGHYYAAELFEKTHEVRVHCAHGKILFTQNKTLKAGEIRANQAVTQAAWTTVPWGEYEFYWAKIALEAIEVLGLDFGGVDVMVNKDNKTACICEVNTAPSIEGPYWLGKYASYFSWLFSSPTSRKHWDFRKFNDPQSLTWKKDQF